MIFYQKSKNDTGVSFKLFPFWYNKTMKPFSQEIKDFIKNENWVFAKTYAKTWPHEYIIRDKVHDKDIFLKMGLSLFKQIDS